jgi:lipoyl-dependent peroxiredoxin
MSTTTLYTAKVHTTSGREGSAVSSDGALDVRLSSPGSNRPGTNPEQLFAAGWSACFLSAIGIAASERKLRLGADASVDAEVDLEKGEDGYSLAARLHVSLPGIDRDVIEALIERAHQTCPYSKAIHGNIKVVTTYA